MLIFDSARFNNTGVLSESPIDSDKHCHKPGNHEALYQHLDACENLIMSNP